MLNGDPEEERLVQMPDKEEPDESNSVLHDKGLNFPVGISEGILEESSDVLECSPFLGHISGFSSGSDELGEVTIGLLSKGSI